MRFREAVIRALEVVRKAEVCEAYVQRGEVENKAFFRVTKKGELIVDGTTDASHLTMDWNDWKVSYLTNLVKEI